MLKKPSKGFFVTGTDTGVGKTLVVIALLIALKKHGFSTAALKPIACGATIINGELRNDDAVVIQKYMTEKYYYNAINPFAFAEPIAPGLAAQHVGRILNSEQVLHASQTILQSKANYIIIEGIGGWYVPINEHEKVADLAKAYNYPVIVVVGMRLGVINHTLLLFEALQNAGSNTIGWIANIIDDEMLFIPEVIQTIKRNTSLPLLGVIPFQNRLDYQKISTYINIAQLL